MVKAPNPYATRHPYRYHIYGSPFVVIVAPSAASAHACTASGDGLVSAAPGETAHFSIVARDAFGNPRGVGGDPFEVLRRSEGGCFRSGFLP